MFGGLAGGDFGSVFGGSVFRAVAGMEIPLPAPSRLPVFNRYAREVIGFT